jgi:hypothetical protein
MATDFNQLEVGTGGNDNLPFRDTLNKDRRFIPLRLDDALGQAAWAISE